MSKNYTNSIIISILLILGAVLRFYNFPEIQLMNDELSALIRTNFSNFKDLIIGGVLTDTHPPLIQVFLYYWIKLVGNEEIALRFPFILSGIASIYLVYLIGKKWFNATIGLISASFVTTLQYPVLYSQLARPYVSGLFFSLCMVWCWTNLFFGFSQRKNIWLIGYIISSVLCAYNHHFSLLFAFLVGLTGLFFINKNLKKRYILSGFIILLLYLPNLPIFFTQLKMGGIGGWLGAPTPAFLVNYIQYIFHFSSLLYIFVIALILSGIFIGTGKNNNLTFNGKENFYVTNYSSKLRIVCLFWFITPIAIGYCYSVFINPVLQYSMLIFSFPFFLFLIFSFFNNISNQLKILIVLAIVCVNIYSLVYEREHYKMFYIQTHEQFIKDTFSIIDSIKNEKDVTVYSETPPEFSNYYFKKYDRKYDYLYFDHYQYNPNIPEFNKLVKGLNTNYFILSGFCMEYVALVKESYPYLIKRNKGFTHDYYCFSKIKPRQPIEENILFLTENNLSKSVDGWNIDKSKLLEVDDSNNTNSSTNYLMVDSLTEYAATFEANLSEIAKDKYLEINVSASFKNIQANQNVQIVISIEDEDKNSFWRSSDVSNYFLSDTSEFTAHLIVFLKDQKIDYAKHNNLKVYLWNKDKNNFMVSNLKIEFIRSNPYVYSLFEKVPN